MKVFAPDRVATVWLILMVATAANWWLGRASGLSKIDAAIPNLIIIAVAFMKAHLVGFYFMEIRDASDWLRRVFTLFLLLAFTLLSIIIMLTS